MIIEELKSDFDIIQKKINIERKSVNKYLGLTNFDKLVDFLIIGEDRRFYNHKGFDIIAIIRAIRNRIFYSKKEGASTIEQQLVRVLTNQYDRTLKRKLKEIMLAHKLQKILSKKEIALLYLKLAYYGTEKQGLEKTLKEFNLKLDSLLSDFESASIIARLKYPEPKIYSEKRKGQIEMKTKYLLKIYNSNDKHC